MKRERYLLLSLSVILAVGPAHGSGGSRWCPDAGSHFDFAGVRHYFSSPNERGQCPIPDSLPNILGSPSGLASMTGTADFAGIPYWLNTNIQSLWIGITQGGPMVLYDAYDSFAVNTECGDPHDDLGKYEPHLLAGSSGTYHPTFGGAGWVTFWVDGGAQSYGNFASTPARSTDVDMDGDTDEADEALIRAALARAESPLFLDKAFDLNWSGAVDATDLQIMMVESRRRVGGARYGRSVCRSVSGEGVLVPYSAAADLYVVPPSQPTLVTGSESNGVWTLNWVNGNDGSDVRDGGSATRRVHALQIRTSTQHEITASTFLASDSLPAPAPGDPGQSQSLTTAIAGAVGIRYFGIRSVDDSGEPSAITSLVVDPPPSRTTDLAAAAGRGNIKLSWTAPGENGSAGTATAYDMRFCQCDSSSYSWASATPVSAPVPGSSGTQECLVVSDLEDGKVYTFALKTRDAGGNWSAMSNKARATTRTTGSLVYECSGASMRAEQDGLGELSRQALELGFFSPNPARDAGTITLSVPASMAGASVTAGIYDLLGRKLRSLGSSTIEPSLRSFGWDLRDDNGQRVKPGLYFVRVQVGSSSLRRSVVVSN